MKTLFAVGLLALGWFAGCADTPPAEEVRERLERGATGQGAVGPLDRSDDPYVRPRGSGSASGTTTAPTKP